MINKKEIEILAETKDTERYYAFNVLLSRPLIVKKSWISCFPAEMQYSVQTGCLDPLPI